MPENALTPLLHHDEFVRAQGMTYDPQQGGFEDDDNKFWFWYLHHDPRHGPTLKLWGGPNGPGQKPDPDPEPEGNYFMTDDWLAIQDGGILLENRNWVIKDLGNRTGALYEILAITIGQDDDPNQERRVVMPRIG